jgi:hypothetical protein
MALRMWALEAVKQWRGLPASCTDASSALALIERNSFRSCRVLGVPPCESSQLAAVCNCGLPRGARPPRLARTAEASLISYYIWRDEICRRELFVVALHAGVRWVAPAVDDQGLRKQFERRMVLKELASKDRRRNLGNSYVRTIARHSEIDL